MHSTLTMGQYLSILPFTVGFILLGWVFTKRIPTDVGIAERLGKAVNSPPAKGNDTSGSSSSNAKSGKRSKGAFGPEDK